MSDTAFSPPKHGFHFPNSFDDVWVVPAGFTQFQFETTGRCGGMAYGALDYFHAGMAPPTHTAADFGGPEVPPSNSILASYILHRLLDSFAQWTAINFVEFTLASDAKVLEMTRANIPIVKSQIDNGRPVVIGLVNATSLKGLGSENHQVVVHGYSGDDFLVYDCNQPDTDVTLVFDPGDSKWHFDPGADTWRGWFFHNYSPATPIYHDLILDQGVWVSSAFPNVNRPFDCSFVARNAGQFDAHLSSYFLYVRGPNGEVLDDMLAGDQSGTLLKPGERRTVEKSTQTFRPETGAYTLSAGFIAAAKTSAGGLIYETLPALTPGTKNPITVTAVPVQAGKQMITAADPDLIPLHTPVTMIVSASDKQTGQAIIGADVYVGATPVGKTARPFTFNFRGPSAITVHSPGYPVTRVDCTFDAADELATPPAAR